MDIKVRNKGSKRPKAIRTPNHEPSVTVFHIHASVLILLGKIGRKYPNCGILQSLSLQLFPKMDKVELVLPNAFLGVIDNL